MEAGAGQAAQREGLSLRSLAELLKALADETRLAILTILQNGDMCVCEIMGALPISQPAVSHHLKILRQADLVVDRRQGKWIYYRINRAALAALVERVEGTVIQPVQSGRRSQGIPPTRYRRCDDGPAPNQSDRARRGRGDGHE